VNGLADFSVSNTVPANSGSFTFGKTCSVKVCPHSKVRDVGITTIKYGIACRVWGTLKVEGAALSDRGICSGDVNIARILSSCRYP
jgi:hypothetical protein